MHFQASQRLPQEGVYPSIYTYLYRPSPADPYRDFSSSPPSLSADPLQGFLKDRTDLARGSKDLITSLLSQRDELHAYNRYRIDLDQTACQNALLAIEDWPPGSVVDRRRSGLESQLLALEREKRAEDVACWRDKASLTRDLTEAVRDYRLATQKQALLGEESPLEDA